MRRNVTKPPRISLCRACHGTGAAPRTAECPSRPSAWEGQGAAGACPQCGGSGRVTVSAEIELDIRPYNPRRGRNSVWQNGAG